MEVADLIQFRKVSSLRWLTTSAICWPDGHTSPYLNLQVSTSLTRDTLRT